MKYFIKRLLLLVGLFIAFSLVLEAGFGSVYKDADLCADLPEGIGAEDIVVEPEQTDILSVLSVEEENGRIYVTLKGEKPGNTYLEVKDANTGKLLTFTFYKVSPFYTVVNQYMDNFAHYRIFQLGNILFLLLLAIFLWVCFARTQKKELYSHQAIFFAGFGIWISSFVISRIFLWLRPVSMLEWNSELQEAGTIFMQISSPLIVLFAAALCISNLSLIRHEGFRKVNLLGILFAFLMLLGAAVVFYIFLLNYQGPETTFHLIRILQSTLSSMYVVLWCFLIGSMICGIRAAVYTPPLDRDYIIILGCAIKPDGTLYPLIRGRVDRAIAFYREQLETTGKAAILIPSGGKGDDEIMAEGDAMAIYLREQGIPEEHILVENRSATTAQNMLFSKRLIDEQNPEAKTAFSTTNYHVFRSGIISRQQDFYPEGMGSRTRWFFWPNAAVREFAGMVVRMWKPLAVLLVLLIALFTYLESLI